MNLFRYQAWVMFTAFFLLMCFGLLRFDDSYMPLMIPLLLAVPFVCQTRMTSVLLGLFLGLAGSGVFWVGAVREGDNNLVAEGPLMALVAAGSYGVLFAVLVLSLKQVHLVLLKKWPTFGIPRTADNVSEFVAAGTILFQGMVRPRLYLRLSESSSSGTAHFYTAFSLYCFSPVVLLNLAAIVGEAQFPESFYFADLNPWTVVIAVPAQLMVGPLIIYLFAWCIYAGMNAAGLTTSEDAEQRVMTTGWYAGTALSCLFYWFLGFGIFFGSLRALSDNVEPALNIALVVGLAVWLRLALSGYYVNVPQPSGAKAARVFFGFIAGVVLFFIVTILVGFVVQLMLMAILHAM